MIFELTQGYHYSRKRLQVATGDHVKGAETRKSGKKTLLTPISFLLQPHKCDAYKAVTHVVQSGVGSKERGSEAKRYVIITSVLSLCFSIMKGDTS